MEKRNTGQLWLVVRVKDSGLGMTDEEQKKLFEPFRQTKQGRNTDGGTGLGLAISRQHARLMGGELTVSSHPGQGSMFRLEIPLEVGDSSLAMRRNEAHRVIGICAGTNSPRILVVDDQFENRDFLMKLLTTVGFSVRGADNGEAALRYWEEWNPELILMDVHMPIMDGIEATRRIKADVQGKETRIIVLTASAMDEDRRIAAHSGADDFIAKPCRENELLEKMRALLHITYDYEEPKENPEGGPRLSTASLLRLPPDLLRELRDATLNGNKRLMNQLILRVGATDDEGCAHALQALVDKYEYDALIQLLDEASRV